MRPRAACVTNAAALLSVPAREFFAAANSREGMERPPNPIVVRPGEVGRLTVLLPYNPERLAKIKIVPGRVWHGEQKRWSVPGGAAALAALRALFAGDELRLESAGTEPSPNPALIRRTREARQVRHRSPRTEESYLGWVLRFIQETGPPGAAWRSRDRALPVQPGDHPACQRLDPEPSPARAHVPLHPGPGKKDRPRGRRHPGQTPRTSSPWSLSRDEVRAVLGRMTGVLSPADRLGLEP